MKLLKKRSKRFSDITESRRWWNWGMDEFAEWTFEGSFEIRIAGK